MLEHSAVVSQYRENRSGLQAQMEAGITFKKSILKSVAELEFVPVNLHIQQMKVAIEGSDDKGEGERGEREGEGGRGGRGGEEGEGGEREGEGEREGKREGERVRYIGDDYSLDPLQTR